jgi:hypothetical protein
LLPDVYATAVVALSVVLIDGIFQQLGIFPPEARSGLSGKPGTQSVAATRLPSLMSLSGRGRGHRARLLPPGSHHITPIVSSIGEARWIINTHSPAFVSATPAQIHDT